MTSLPSDLATDQTITYQQRAGGNPTCDAVGWISAFQASQRA